MESCVLICKFFFKIPLILDQILENVSQWEIELKYWYSGRKYILLCFPMSAPHTFSNISSFGEKNYFVGEKDSLPFKIFKQQTVEREKAFKIDSLV